MRYPVRTLPSAEWGQLRDEFQAHHVPLPNPATSQIVVAEDGDRVVAFLVVQQVTHLEPLWIDAAYRGRVYWPALVQAAQAHCDTDRPCFAFAPDAHVAAMASCVGFTRVPWTVYQGGRESCRF